MRTWIRVFTGILLLFCNAGFTVYAINLQHKQEQYERLAHHLEMYNNIVKSNEWVMLPQATRLQAGDSSELVLSLRNNLLLTRDLHIESDISDAPFFDDTLKEGVRNFQLRHGLLPDGIVGPQTLEALRVRPSRRIEQIKLNMQRWEAFYATTSQPSIMVNIPDYTLQLLDSSANTVWQTRVVVGLPTKGYRTVRLKGEITYLVINPTWTVPKSIIRREIIPIMRKDQGYLSRNHMHVYSYSGSKRVKVPSGSINWFKADPDKNKFQIVQQAGKWNALGKIKFPFPNPFSIYLHDTPAKTLFNQQHRAYSHGCIRVQDPEILATYLLSTDWSNLEDISKRLDTKSPEKTVLLPKPVPVSISYFTSWVSDDGLLQFRKDIYKFDVTAAPSGSNSSL